MQTKKQKLDGINETDVVLDLTVVDIPVTRISRHSGTRKHGTSASPSCSNKALWVSQPPGVGGAWAMSTFELKGNWGPERLSESL